MRETWPLFSRWQPTLGKRRCRAGETREREGGKGKGKCDLEGGHGRFSPKDRREIGVCRVPPFPVYRIDERALEPRHVGRGHGSGSVVVALRRARSGEGGTVERAAGRGVEKCCPPNSPNSRCPNRTTPRAEANCRCVINLPAVRGTSSACFAGSSASLTSLDATGGPPAGRPTPSRGPLPPGGPLHPSTPPWARGGLERDICVCRLHMPAAATTSVLLWRHKSDGEKGLFDILVIPHCRCATTRRINPLHCALPPKTCRQKGDGCYATILQDAFFSYTRRICSPPETREK